MTQRLTAPNLDRPCPSLALVTLLAGGPTAACRAGPGPDRAAGGRSRPPTSRVPAGFRIAVFASGLTGARHLAVSPEGTLVVARRAEIVALPDRDRDGRAEPEVLLSGLTYAHSLAFANGYLYFTTTPALMRVRWVDGRPSGTPERLADLPTSTPSLHTSRSLVIGRDGRLYVSIGSSCNVCVEPDARRTTIQVFDADGTQRPHVRLGAAQRRRHGVAPRDRQAVDDRHRPGPAERRSAARRDRHRRGRQALRLSVLLRPRRAQPGARGAGT